MENRKQIELMAPAGGFDALQAALDSGANSVYFGVDQLNMRARATMNFTLGDLEEIAQRCSDRGAKSYLTLNAIIYDLSILIEAERKSLSTTIKHNVEEDFLVYADQNQISQAIINRFKSI